MPLLVANAGILVEQTIGRGLRLPYEGKRTGVDKIDKLTVVAHENFNAVNEAQQEKETLINQAKSEYNKVIPKARGQADETIQQAKGYATERINNAEGEASRFTALYKEYIKAPEVTKRRIYLETMSNVIPKIGNVVITDPKGNNVLPLLQMQMNKKTGNNEN